jgi:hypothetical protein
MTERARLPIRRPHELFDFEHGGFRFTAGVGRFADGAPAELFLSGAKVGTDLAVATCDAAIVVSIALQHGVTLKTIRHALARNGDGTAAGPVAAALDILAAEA